MAKPSSSQRRDALELTTDKLADKALVYADAAAVSEEVFAALVGSAEAAVAKKASGLLCEVGTKVLCLKPHAGTPSGTLGLGALHRQAAHLRLGVGVDVRPFEPSPDAVAASLSFEVAYLGRDDASSLVLDVGALAKSIKSQFAGHVFGNGQQAAIQFEADARRKLSFKLTCTGFEHVDIGDAGGASAAAAGAAPRPFAQLLASTDVQLTKTKDSVFKVKGGSASRRPQLFGKGFNFASLGIGGLDTEFQEIFRKAFASRLLPPAISEKMGLNHVRGMLLFGPPGCGKTLIARQIGKALQAREPKVVNGPEVLNKFVGQSEENIRKLFEDAEKEQAERGDESDLHIIIFDEIDAICKRRGTTGGGTGVGDSVVNQLLSKMDGVEALNNILVIGMTNRKDMIDSAVLRPGRLEVHVEISLPDEAGRAQILGIHTAKLKANGFLGKDVDVGVVAKETKNYTGAEIEGLVKTARSYAISRVVDPSDLTKALDASKVCVTQEDFMMAVDETVAAFGAREGELERLCEGGIIAFGSEFRSVVTTLQRLVRQSMASSRSPLLTACVHGPSGAGKTALTVRVALDSGIPMVKRVGAEDMLGMGELSKARVLHEAFEDAYKSSQSLLILDDIERMMEYVPPPIGPRLSNAVLQALLVLLRRPPPKEGRRLLVVCTTSEPNFLRQVGMLPVFTVVERIPLVVEEENFTSVLREAAGDVMDDAAIVEAAAALTDQALPVKRVMQVLELARQAARDRALEELGSDVAGTPMEAAAASGAGGGAASQGAGRAEVEYRLTVADVLEAATASTDGMKSLMMDLGSEL
ncbi:hypothetical protein FNF27_00572 [Cafeteria roenbergensis]|uniref:Vesicle-fusing ATPase n=2 Tax=Cafeteria roenbergensis TaxID=33653 RepID=A0A5A8EL33_CAFRO|nr:hypothetical protein FNF27_00572 [Cafeteria roenbergensis]